MSKDKTALVIGGGPAGASAALGLLRRGLHVTVLEQRDVWRGRVCGSFLNPEAVNHLAWLGLKDLAVKRGAVRVEKVQVTNSQGDSAELPLGLNGQAALGFWRKDLEDLLLETVTARGGRVHLGHRAAAFTHSGVGWSVQVQRAGNNGHASGPITMTADHLIIADGRFSLGRPRARPTQAPPAREGWYGWNGTFTGVTQNPGDMSLHFYPDGYVGVLTFMDGTSNVCGLRRKRATALPEGWGNVFAEALAKQPCFRDVMGKAALRGEWRGVGPLPFTWRLENNPYPMRVGDAAAVGDPFMGEGIGRALASGPLLWEALNPALTQGGGPQELFRRRWRRSYGARQCAGAVLRGALARSSLQNPLLKGLVRFPRLTARLLSMFHGGLTLSETG